MFKLHVLASGSKGNASILENTLSGHCILIDCGISKRDFLSRCDEASLDPTMITDILITHEHTDHTKGLGVVTRGLAKMGVALNLRTSSAIRNASIEIGDALDGGNVSFIAFKDCSPIDLGDILVKPFQTSHDAAQSFGFRFETQRAQGSSEGLSKVSSKARDASSQSDALAYLTDTGFVTHEAEEAMQFARIVAIESNHDIGMLMRGSYPYVLKKRISSDRGHLSNEQSAAALDELLSSLGGTVLEHVVAMHVSQENNTYDLPAASLGGVLEKLSHRANVSVSHQSHVVSVG